MAHLEITHRVDDEGLRRVRSPRTDLVREKQSGDDLFSLVDGPFEFYERSLVVESGPNGHLVIERIDYQLSIPWFGLFFRWPVRHALRNRREDATT
ncbi:MAG: hypothetical protein VX222_01375, partial [Actinomycetota bacterium]|nr:hypothetical protein [Actinomycetota bacterium]